MTSLARDEFSFLFSGRPTAVSPTFSWTQSLNRATSLFSLRTCFGLASPSIEPENYLRASAAVVGLNAINSLTLPFLLKNNFGLSPAGMGLVTVGISVPVFLKPFYAIWADNHPIFGLRRKPYLMIANSIDVVAKLGIGLSVKAGAGLPVVAGFLLLGASAMVLEGTMRDTLLMETSHDSDGTALIADVSALAAFASLSVSYLSGSLLSVLEPGELIMGSACIPLMALSLSARLNEDVYRARLPAMKLEMLADTFNHSGGVLQGQAMSACVGSLVPNFQDAMFYFYTENLKLTPQFFGKFKLCGNISSLLANAGYRAFLKDADQNKLCLTASALMIPVIGMAGFVTTNTTEWFGLSPPTFIIVRHFLFDGLNTLSSIPNTVMLSKVAPRGHEGPFFAVYGNVNDLAQLMNGAVSSTAIRAFGITSHHFGNLTSLVMFTTAMNVAAAPWTLWTPESEGRHLMTEEPEVEREMEERPREPLLRVRRVVSTS